jgi:glutathione-specific gamma-glutamylcyclotransferase
MRLTPELVALVPALAGEPGPMPEGSVRPTDADYEAVVREILAAAPLTDAVWIFAYGSLIWNPACEFVEERIGTVSGWRRSFCLGWNTRFRGSVGRPSVMLALDRGGACKGVVYRLPPGAVEENLSKLIRREMPLKPSPFPARWVRVATEAGPLFAVAFVIDRKSDRYIGRLSVDEIANALAIAVGERGSMAEYLYSTVRHLEDRGIHDRYLWQIQKLVAERIESLTTKDLAP